MGVRPRFEAPGFNPPVVDGCVMNNLTHINFLKVVADMSSRFISAEASDVDSVINDMLEKIVKLFDLDRGYLFSFSPDKRYMTNTLEKCAEGIIPVKNSLQNVPLNRYKWWRDHIFNNSFIQIEDVDKLPKEAEEEKAIFKKMEIKSIIAVPITVNNSVEGFIGLDSVKKLRSWSVEDIDLLKILANSLAETSIKIAASTEVERLTLMHSILLNIAKLYINIPVHRLNSAIMLSLKEMAEFVEADRAYIFSYDFEKSITSNTHEWCAKGIKPEIDNLQDVQLLHMSDWVEKHRNGEAFIVTDVTQLPFNGAGCVRDIIEPQGVKSLIAVPMIDGETLIGFVGFDSVIKQHLYSEKEKTLLSFFSQMIINVNKRAYYEEVLRKAKTQAEQASRAKSEFLANMSHEIRTPLNSVIGFTELLNKTPLSVSQKKFVENANISAQTLMEIINDVLDFSKIEAGRLELSEAETDIIETAEQVCDIVKYQASQKNIELLLNIGPDIPRYGLTDPIRLKQILVNLISNAIKFTEKGEVELSVKYEEKKQKKGTFTFSVRDTGIGISAEDQKKLFIAFTQADSSTTRKFGGTGLGLVISNYLAEKMGGKIELNSSPGIGSTFYFSITTEVNSAKERFDSKDIKTKRVLIVDDNPRNLSILENTLKSWGVESTLCDNGLEAIKIIKISEPFDVILLDFKMPLISGIDTLRMLRADESIDKNSQNILIMCSSDDDSLINDECRKSTGVHKSIKPVKITELYNYLINLTKPNIKPQNILAEQKVSIPSNNMRITTFARNPVIIIAEDVKMNLILINTMLNNIIPNAKLIEANNGQKAVDLTEEINPDMILMDIHMPIVDGLTATRRIREINRIRGTYPVIVALTASASEEDKKRCIEAGMDDYISKPINQKILYEIINQYLGQNRSLINGKTTETIMNNSVPEDITPHFNRQEMLQRIDNDEEVLIDLIDTLKEEVEISMNDLKQALSSNSADQIKKSAHKIKGIALNMSFGKMSVIAKTIEQANAAGSSKFDTLLQELEDEWNLLKIILYK